MGSLDWPTGSVMQKLLPLLLLLLLLLVQLQVALTIPPLHLSSANLPNSSTAIAPAKAAQLRWGESLLCRTYRQQPAIVVVVLLVLVAVVVEFGLFVCLPRLCKLANAREYLAWGHNSPDAQYSKLPPFQTLPIFFFLNLLPLALV